MPSGGTSSSRSPFRSQSGCCVCGTKSSSSRFTASVRYSDHFGGCFGPLAANRSGDLCNACVLCVKRWLQRVRQPGLFAQVVDSKCGPGPKHMKEITKRARRREAKLGLGQGGSAISSSSSSSSMATTTSGTTPISSGLQHHRVCTSGSMSTQRSSNTIMNTNTTASGSTANGFARRSSPLMEYPRSATAAIAKHGQTNGDTLVDDSQHLCFAGGIAASSAGSVAVPHPCFGSLTGGKQGNQNGQHHHHHHHHQQQPSHQEPKDIYSPSPVGATFTRAAAAAIRKSVAANRSPFALTASCPTSVREFRRNTVIGRAASSQHNDSHNGMGLGRVSCCPIRGDSASGCCYCSPSSGCCCCCCGQYHHSHTTASSSCSSRHRARTMADCCNGGNLGCPTRNADLGTRSPPCCAFCYSDGVARKRAKHDTVLEPNCLCCEHSCTPSPCHATRHSNPNPPVSAPTSHSPVTSASPSACVTRSQTSTAMTSNRCIGATEFRHPPPPPPAAVTSKSNDLLPGSPSVTALSTRRYNRRVVLPPVRMTDNAEVNSLLREIMERNSQALNFDSREMHMAVQKELRLRSRTVQQHASSTASSSGRASSVSSTDGSLDTTSNAITSTTPSSASVDRCGCPSSALDQEHQHPFTCCCRGHHHQTPAHCWHCCHEHHLRHRSCVQSPASRKL